MKAVQTSEPASSSEPPLLHTIEEAADVLRIGRTLAYALARRYEVTGGLEGLPVIRLGNCMRVPRWALLELARNGRTVPLGELIPTASESKRRLDAELISISQIGRDVDAEPDSERLTAERSARVRRQARVRRDTESRSAEQLRLLSPS
jgi:hypothetical protein